MLSIGELAHRTGVSRRMLRHWEEIGLLAPAEVDDRTAYRKYSVSQTGRVRAIAALRAVGFGLDAVADLLSSDLSESRLMALLQTREVELVAQISGASMHLQEVRVRLDSLREGRRVIMSSLELGPLPGLQLASLQTSVGDESEIGVAVDELTRALRSQLAAAGRHDAEVVLTYDGMADEESIQVTAGVSADGRGTGPELALVVVPSSERGVTVRYDVPPPSIGDAWITLDAQLEQSRVRTRGTYRQTLTSGGGVVLQAPVVSLL
ncbi:MerR family transcriptional regulator [Modestobacter sp. VKM Ac-2984]|uniref:MerR family transcriptional regulator n=1 Tax=Modestobacter sp. VKM Ac-2984 TaxID=3004138 RepID=UPI0022AAFD19|nr:MerR family transcriptional regulator [Modestobacter sp. VKM Ac-2984]MCZ2818467.1 MerR family transcriptional regulator [Modestobacter sp. VKM Ac-2984]